MRPTGTHAGMQAEKSHLGAPRVPGPTVRMLLVFTSGVVDSFALREYSVRVACRGLRGAAINNEPRVNERIHVDQVRLVGPGGEQVGVVRVGCPPRGRIGSCRGCAELQPARREAHGLREVCYESAQKAREARRNQSNTVIKSICIGLKIDGNDYQTKKRQT